MPWDRGAWEKATSGVGNNDPDYSPTISAEKPKKVSNNKRDYLKKLLVKFMSQGWNMSKKKKTQYLDNNYYNAPYRLRNNVAICDKISDLINSKSNQNKILVVSNNDLILDELFLEFSIKNNYRIFKSSKAAGQLETLVNNVEEFEKINTDLFNKYAIKLFTQTDDIGHIEDLKILSENLYPVDNKTANLLNDFLKAYWEFYEISNYSNIDLALAERDVVSEVKKVSTELLSTKNYINRLNKILNLLDFNIDNLDKFDLEILQNDPILLDKEDADRFLNILDEYHKLNTLDDTPLNYIKKLPSNNFILGIISNFKNYVNSQEGYEQINLEISSLKNDLESYGLLVDNLNQYHDIKDKLSDYENISFVDDEDYLILNEKIIEFLKSNVSFNEYFERCKQNIVFNSTSNSIYSNVNDAIYIILDVFDELKIKIDSLSEYDNHKDDFKILEDYIKFNKKNTVANEETITGYAVNLYDDLKDICNKLLQNCIEVDETDLDYIMYNISTVKRIMTNMGVNISSLNQLNKSFSIISNIENDTSNNIFTNKTAEYVQNEAFTIHNDIDTLKSSMNYLLETLNNKSNLGDLPIDELSKSFNNQFKIGFLKSNLESLISSTNTFEEILENYEATIQNAMNLMDANNDFKFKEDVERIFRELTSISQMHESKNYSNNQLMINSISSYKSSVNDDFNKLVRKGIFSKDLNMDEAEGNLEKLAETMPAIHDFINANDLCDADFNSIIKNNEEIIVKSQELESRLDESTIYNFYDICKELNGNYHDFDLVKEILDLSSKLGLQEYDQYSSFSLDDLIDFSKSMNRNIEFSELVNKGILSRDFKYSQDKMHGIDSKIGLINNGLNDLRLDNSVLDNFGLVNVGEMDDISEQLRIIEKYLKSDSTNVDELIENYKISLNMLLNLCDDHYIEFETNNRKFNTSDFIFNLEGIQDDLESNIELYEIQRKVESYSQIIQNNLINIWEGPQTDIETIKDKMNNDLEFTKQYTEGIYTDKSLENLYDISQSDLLFLDELKTMNDEELKSRYILSYKKSDILIPEINRLNNLKNDDLSSFLEIFLSINKIYKSKRISDCINLLEYNIKHTDSIRLINEYENNLKSHSIIYFKFFDKRKFDMPIEDVIARIENHFKYTELLNSQVINERYIETIRNNFNDFLKEVEQLVVLKNEILKDCIEYFGQVDMSFEEIKESWNDVDEANLVLMNLNTLRNSFNNNYSSYFDHVYIVDDDDLTGEDKLHMFLISKNKISNLKLMEE